MSEVSVEARKESETQTYGRIVEIEGANPQPKREELMAIDGKMLNLVFDPNTQKHYLTFNTTWDMKGNAEGRGTINIAINPIPEELAARVKVGRKIKIRIYHED